MALARTKILAGLVAVGVATSGGLIAVQAANAQPAVKHVVDGDTIVVKEGFST